jgi:hypothetical protein
MLQFRVGQFDQPGEPLPMFCTEVLSFEKSPARLDYSALAQPGRIGRLGAPQMRATRAGPDAC